MKTRRMQRSGLPAIAAMLAVAAGSPVHAQPMAGEGRVPEAEPRDAWRVVCRQDAVEVLRVEPLYRVSVLQNGLVTTQYETAQGVVFAGRVGTNVTCSFSRADQPDEDWPDPVVAAPDPVEEPPEPPRSVLRPLVAAEAAAPLSVVLDTMQPIERAVPLMAGPVGGNPAADPGPGLPQPVADNLGRPIPRDLAVPQLAALPPAALPALQLDLGRPPPAPVVGAEAESPQAPAVPPAGGGSIPAWVLDMRPSGPSAGLSASEPAKPVVPSPESLARVEPGAAEPAAAPPMAPAPPALFLPPPVAEPPGPVAPSLAWVEPGTGEPAAAAPAVPAPPARLLAPPVVEPPPPLPVQARTAAAPGLRPVTLALDPLPVPIAARPGPAVVAPPRVQVQLAAVPGMTEAVFAWSDLRRRHRELLDGYEPVFQPADVGDGGSVVRLRVEVAGLDEARDLCAILRTAGLDCFIPR